MNSFKARLAAAIALLSLPLAASAAPPPPPGAESSLGRMQAREAINQTRRFEAAGLPIQTAPANGGMCVIDLTGSFAPAAGQNGPSGSYRLYEIQRFEVSTTPTNPGQTALTYPLKWTTVGNGERHEDNGVGTSDDWTFSVSAASGGQVVATKIASTGVRGVGVHVIPSAGGLVVTQQQTVIGNPPKPRGTITTSAPAYLGFGNMTAVPPAGSPPGTAMQVSGLVSKLRVPQNTMWGYARPAYAGGSIWCTWTLTVAP